MSEPRAHPPAGRGFTLLEVLVAVALLGIVVSVLARSAIQGMSYEGDATRRTRASLIADSALWNVEAGLKLAPPQAKHEESDEEEEFHVTVDVAPLQLGPSGLEALLPPLPKKTGSARQAKPDKNGELARGGEATKKKQPAVGIDLFRIQVQVAWQEGLRDLAVTRSTFAYDATAAAEALGAEEEQTPGKGKGKATPTPTPKPKPQEEQDS